MSKLLLSVLSFAKQLGCSVLLLLSFFSISANAATSTILADVGGITGPQKSFSVTSTYHGNFDFKCTDDTDSVAFTALTDCATGTIAGFYGANEYDPINGTDPGVAIYSADGGDWFVAIWVVLRQQSGNEFDFDSFEIAEISGVVDTLEIVGYRDGAIIAREQVSINVGGLRIRADTLVNLPNDFDNVDEVRIRQATVFPDYPDAKGFAGQKFHDFIINDAPVVNIAPTITVDDATASYTENATATQIDAAATLSDADGDTDWNGGTLEVQITANAEAADEISLSDLDADGTAITVSGTNILANGTDIGDLSVPGAVVTHGAALTITFDSDATNANVQEVLQSLRYRNTSDSPGTNNRTITFTATDTNAAAVNDTRSISVTAMNDDPIQSGILPTDLVVSEDVTGNLDLSAVSLSDADAANITLTLSVTGGVLTVSDGASYSLNITGSGTTVVSIYGAPASINGYLDTATNIKFLGAANASGDNAGVLTLVGNDGGHSGAGGGSNISFGAINIDIAAQNDAPVDISLSATSINQSSTGVGTQIGLLSAVDIDSGSFTFSLVAQGTSVNGSCGAGNDANNGIFQVTGSAFETQSVTAAGSYKVCLQVSDGATNYQEAFGITVIDNGAPDVTISGASGNINAAFIASFSFSESVTGFVIGDISASNASVTNFSGSGASYSALITPTAANVTVDVAAGVAKDAADNGNTAATQLSVNYDAGKPSVAISGASGNINAAFTANFSFSELVTGFVIGDIAVSNASITNFSGSGSSYSATITPTAAGSVTVDVAANVAIDSASNGNTVAAQLTATYDVSKPSLTITGASGNINAAFTASFSFSESVTGFVIGDISASNASVTNFSGSGSSYSATITPTAAGSVTVDVAANVAIDSASNGNTTAAQLTATYDPSQPSLTITGASGNINAAFTASFSFSESVTGFAMGDISASNASVTNFSGSGASYSATITPTAAGSVTVDVAADVAMDSASNGNTAAAQLTATYDASQPSVTISGASGDINAAFTASFSFSESVTGFAMGDIAASNASVTNFSGSGASYSATITPTAAGSVTVDVAANVAMDSANNGNTVAAQLTATYDVSQPSLTITGASGNINSAFSATFSFSESVTGFAIGDISLSNASVTNFSGSGASYSATITPTAAGSVTVDVAADVAVDSANNGNTVAAQLSATYDASQPSVTISGASGDINAAFSASFSFSEVVTGFDAADISVSNASVSSFSGSGATYTALITPTAAGSVTVDVAANVAMDSANNGNTAAAQLTATYDASQPSLTITGASGDINAAFTATFSFSESVTGFDASDISVSNASVSSFSGSGATYTALITPTAAGSVTVDVAANVAMDSANNGNTAAAQLTATYDASQPSIAITGASGDINAAFSATFSFSEVVTGFAIGDISVSNASVTNFSGSGSSYSATITPTAAGSVTVDVAANVAIDSANNGNTAAAQLTATYDASRP
ncbi:Ig-like domain-containing protein, partial [Shewanella abyssi]|uniref:beta strand repeat-containing protein n=1 Tax=Shewanella abyssi TaxID=311789 RepID=UPI00200F93A9